MSPAVAVHIILCAQCTFLVSAVGGSPPVSEEAPAEGQSYDDDIDLIQVKVSSLQKQRDPASEPQPNENEHNWNIKPIHIKVKVGQQADQEESTEQKVVDYEKIAENAAQAVEAADKAIAATKHAMAAAKQAPPAMDTQGPKYDEAQARIETRKEQERAAIRQVLSSSFGGLGAQILKIFGGGGNSTDVKSTDVGSNSTNSTESAAKVAKILQIAKPISFLLGSMWSFFAGIVSIGMSMLLILFGAVNTGFGIMDVMNMAKNATGS